MLLADSSKAREIDRLTIEKYKIPSVLLMENAGMRIADEAIATGANTFAVVCGKGNNGGDGSAAARHLKCFGKEVSLIFPSGTQSVANDAKLMLDCARNAEVKIISGFDSDAKNAIKSSEVVIDAIFGIGLKGAPEGVFSDAIRFVNSLGKYVIAADIPSGVDCDNGSVFGEAVKCNETVTFGVGRLGTVLYPAKEYAGKVKVREISFVPSAVSKVGINVQTLQYKACENPPEDCHKNTVGKVLLAAGSVGMSGAACISATAALRCGAGVVTLCVPKFLNSVAEEKLTEIMTVGVSDNGNTVSRAAAEEILSLSEKYDSLVIGCGLGCNAETKFTVNHVVGNAKCPVIIDADGINSLEKESLRKAKNNTVITPHIGEMARLTGISAEEVKKNAVKVASEFAVKYNTAVVLKSASTAVAFPDGEVYVNTIGNSGMATAGSGDALAGIIGTCVARESCFKTAVLNGVWLHSAAGDNAAERLGKRYMCASDITESLKYVFKEV